MDYKVYLRGGSETNPNKGIVEVLVPKQPVMCDNERQLEVIVNRTDGSLEKVYRFERQMVISIKELK